MELLKALTSNSRPGNELPSPLPNLRNLSIEVLKFTEELSQFLLSLATRRISSPEISSLQELIVKSPTAAAQVLSDGKTKGVEHHAFTQVTIANIEMLRLLVPSLEFTQLSWDGDTEA